MSSIKSPVVSVIIVNYNSGSYLKECADALKKQTFQDFDVIIIDNGSTDGSLDKLGLLPERFRVHMAGKNIGFAKANNIGANITEAPWIATLNADAFAEPEWLENLIRATHRHPDATMFGSTLINAKHPAMLDGTGDVYHAFGIAWRGNYGKHISRLPPEGETFSPCAAAALYRRDAFLAAGGFDERFFCYCEDVDLGFRLRLAGGICIQVPDAVARHVGSGISGRTSHFTIYHGTRNRLWTFIKNMPAPLLLLMAPAHLFIHLLFIIRSLTKGYWRATISATIDGIKQIYPILKSRRETLGNSSISTWQVMRMLTWSPVKLLLRRHDIRPVNPQSKSP